LAHLDLHTREDVDTDFYWIQTTLFI